MTIFLNNFIYNDIDTIMYGNILHNSYCETPKLCMIAKWCACLITKRQPHIAQWCKTYREGILLLKNISDSNYYKLNRKIRVNGWGQRVRRNYEQVEQDFTWTC